MFDSWLERVCSTFCELSLSLTSESASPLEGGEESLSSSSLSLGSFLFGASSGGRPPPPPFPGCHGSSPPPPAGIGSGLLGGRGLAIIFNTKFSIRSKM